MRGRANAAGGGIKYVNAQIGFSLGMGHYLFAFNTDEGPKLEKHMIDGADGHDPISYRVPLNSLAFGFGSGPSNVAPISTPGLELVYRYDITDSSLVAVYKVTGDFTLTRLYGSE